MPEDVKALDERRRALFAEVGRPRAASRQGAARACRSCRSSPVTSGQGAARVGAGARPRSDPRGLRCARDTLVRARARAPAAARREGTRLSAQIQRERRGARAVGGARAAQDRSRRESRCSSARRDPITVSRGFRRPARASTSAAAELRAAELAVVSARGATRRRGDREEVASGVAGSWPSASGSSSELKRDKRLHDELDRAYTDLRTDLNVQLRPEISRARERVPRRAHRRALRRAGARRQYNILGARGRRAQAGDLRRRGGSGEPGAAPRHLADDRRARGPELLAAHPRRGVRLARRVARGTTSSSCCARLQDRFEQVILITHIESVREGLDRVITVRYDEETGASRVEQQPMRRHGERSTTRSSSPRRSRRTDGDVARPGVRTRPSTGRSARASRTSPS